jgi:hypothetical protein
MSLEQEQVNLKENLTNISSREVTIKRINLI